VSFLGFLDEDVRGMRETESTGRTSLYFHLRFNLSGVPVESQDVRRLELGDIDHGHYGFRRSHGYLIADRSFESRFSPFSMLRMCADASWCVIVLTRSGSNPFISRMFFCRSETEPRR